MPNNLVKLTNKLLDSANFSTDGISKIINNLAKIINNLAKIINNLDPHKARGHDMVSLRMIKLCGNSPWKPLSTFFNDCLREGYFPFFLIEKKLMLYLFTRKEINNV